LLGCQENKGEEERVADWSEHCGISFLMYYVGRRLLFGGLVDEYRLDRMDEELNITQREPDSIVFEKEKSNS
jgi:hypothetical protein